MNPQNNKKGIFFLNLFIFLGFLLVLVLGLAYFFYGLQPKDFQGEPQEFQVLKGEGLREIAAKLSQRSLIKSITVFKFYTLLTGQAHKLQPGIYELSPAMSLPEIVEVLAKGKVKIVKVTILAGSTVKDIENQLKEIGVLRNDNLTDLKGEQFQENFPFLKNIDSLEGFLFPDTYYFSLGMNNKEIANIFLNNFQKKAWPLLSEHQDWYQRLILASLLEREVPDFNDRQLVAGILLKRLKSNMPLQVDATITYIKCNQAIRNCPDPVVKKNDLTLSSPYNTYQNLGLPPTPISNMSQSSLKASITPIESEYWYYLSSKTGKTIFSRTLKEHNQNILKHL